MYIYIYPNGPAAAPPPRYVFDILIFLCSGPTFHALCMLPGACRSGEQEKNSRNDPVTWRER